jgi:hypothetical protein
MRSARPSIISGAASSWPTRRKLSSRPAPNNARAGSNAKMRVSRPWLVSPPWSSEKARRSWGEARPVRQAGGAHAGCSRTSGRSRPSIQLGLSPGVGLSALRRPPAGHQKRVCGVMKADDLLVKPKPKLWPSARRRLRSRRGHAATDGGASSAGSTWSWSSTGTLRSGTTPARRALAWHQTAEHDRSGGSDG